MARASEFTTVLDRIDSEIAQLQRMKNYLIGARVNADANGDTPAPAPRKRGRKAKAKSEPAAGSF